VTDPHPELIVWNQPGWLRRRVLAPVGAAIQVDDARRLGLHRTGAMARAFNRRDRRHVAERRRIYEERFDALMDGTSRIAMEDGFAIDDSRTRPHLDALLAAGEDLIERFAGWRYEFTKPYLQDISPESAMDTHPALLDFVTTPEVVATVAPSFGYVPLLPGTIPEGVRLMESRTDFDTQADGPWRGSQLYHLDYHSTPTVYVIVAVRDIDPDDGPLHFLGRAASQRVADALGYGRRGVPYRLTDEVVYEHVDPGEVHRFAVKAGTVLFIESSACMHFGSRRPAKPRYQFQYSFTSPVRNDFMELWRPRRVYPARPNDSELRRLVLRGPR
jgi:hypothetical protein